MFLPLHSALVTVAPSPSQRAVTPVSGTVPDQTQTQGLAKVGAKGGALGPGTGPGGPCPTRKCGGRSRRAASANRYLLRMDFLSTISMIITVT